MGVKGGDQKMVARSIFCFVHATAGVDTVSRPVEYGEALENEEQFWSEVERSRF